MERAKRPFPVSSTVGHYSEEKTKVKEFSLCVRHRFKRSIDDANDQHHPEDHHPNLAGTLRQLRAYIVRFRHLRSGRNRGGGL
jgi:hypothetical protein